MHASALRKRPEVVSLMADAACYNDCLKFHTEVGMLGIVGIMTDYTHVFTFTSIHIS